ncbi:MAG: right-handed parallel beta-helix repeat-containing protein [Halanaeroarchaeum sp.]
MPGSGSRVLSLLVLLAAVALLAGSAPVAADSGPTFVESNVTESTTWDGGVYRVVANVTVEPGATLTVTPGTTVEFAAGITLSVAGTVTMNGTAARPVRLVTSRPVAEPGSWGGIRTVGTGRVSVTLRHVRLSNATDGIRISNPDSTVRLHHVTLAFLSGDGIAIRRSGPDTRVTVRASRFISIEGAGISATRTELLPVRTISDLAVTDTEFESIGEAGIALHAKRIRSLSVRGSDFEAVDGTAISLAADRVLRTRIASNEITGAQSGVDIRAWDLGSVTIAGNTIAVESTGIDVLAERTVSALSLVGNRITGGHTGIEITHDPLQGGFYSLDLTVRGNAVSDQRGNGLALHAKLFSDSSMVLRNNTFRHNGGHGALLAVGAFQNASITHNVFRENGGSGLRMAARHVRDATIAENLARGNGGAGIEVHARETMGRVRVIGNDLFDNAGEGLLLESERAARNVSIAANRIAANAYGLVLVGPQTAEVTNNTIVFNTVGFGPVSPRPDAAPGVGVFVTGNVTDVELAGNDVYGHRIGLLIDVSGTVIAEGNYWGAPSGPYHRSINPEGQGNPVVTRRGWVDLIEASEHRLGPAYERPTAALSIEPDPATVGTPVRISGAPSRDGDGTVGTYRFVVNGTPTITGTPTLTRSFERTGSYPVSLRVEDDMGIESAAAATGTVRITESTTTARPTTTVRSATTTRPPSPPTTPAPPTGRGIGIIGLFGGLLGGGLYGVALLLGARGLWQTLRGEFLTVRGRRLHVLAAEGVLIWFAASVPGPPMFRWLAIAGAALWAGLTGGAYLLVRLVSQP